MKRYQALTVTKTDQGDIEARIDTQAPGPFSDGLVAIDVEYSSINYKDALAVHGRSKIMQRFPMTAGIDAAGTVLESRDENFAVGDKVLVTGYELSQAFNGGYAQYLCVPANWVVPLPEGLSLFEAMALGTAGFTAGLAITRMQDNGQDPERGPILVSGATGGVSSIAINSLSALGFQVVALTSKSPDEDAFLEALGAQQILVREHTVVGDRPLEKSQWAGAIDVVGGEVLAWLTRTTRSYGNIAVCGLAGGEQLNTTVMPFILRGVNLLGIDSAYCPMPLRQKIWQRLASDMKPPHLKDIVSDIVSLQDVPTICEAMLAGRTSGRYIVSLKD